MKRLSVFLCALFLVFGIVGNSDAAPMLYTFEGSVSNINDNARIAADWGVNEGDPVRYEILIDFEAVGYLLYNNGTIHEHSDLPDYDTFYTDYVSGALIAEKDMGTYNGPTDIAASHSGTTYNRPTPYMYQFFQVGNPDHGIGVERSWDGPYSMPVIGDEFNSSVEGARDSYGRFTFVYSNLTLTSIEAVPLPPAIWLFVSGLIGVLGFRKKFGKEA